MTIELPKEATAAAIASIQRFFRENRDDEIGNLEAGALLRFFLAELAPVAYNKAVADVQARLQARIMDLDIEVHEPEFQFWQSPPRKRK